ncbi:MAG: Protein of unknown function (DUF1553)/Protein of unknown function [Phycisphaerales bacterium]|nr:Protein of unknown function (DUF1553)/Protein of unknown function [Phycisphaerales bacterium]
MRLTPAARIIVGVLLLTGMAATYAHAEAARPLIASTDRISVIAGGTHRLLVSFAFPDGFEVDATARSGFESDHPEIAVADASGAVRGVSPGSATITASLDGQHTQVKVTVTAPANGEGISFVNDVLPVLSRAGCNAGACHAKPDGQNGFKLSVFAFDPRSDYRAIVAGDRGRRVFPAAPEESLLLRKPTNAVKHGGGQRFKPDSDAYRMIERWIEQGMPYGQPGDSALVSVQVFPSERRYRIGAKQPLLVTAQYADGTARDVTALADFSSTDKDFVKVDDGGMITVGDIAGEGVVIARFMGQVAIARVAIPSDRALPDALYASLPVNNFIDRAVYNRLKRLALAPSDTCTDAEFIRRASLDAIGVLPKPEEVQSFLFDTGADKRARLADRLLQNPAYADYWATKWGDLLRPNTQRVGVKPVYLLDQWLRESFRQNKPYDQFVREIITAQGSTHQFGPVVLYRDRREPADVVTLVSRVFLGVRMECAKCHHHPNEKWSQGDFYQLASCFSQIQRRGQGISAPISGEAEFIWFGPASLVAHPLTGAALKPKPPEGPEFEIDPKRDPRQSLADWMTRPDNPFFARAIVNRVWGEMMGRGIVHPVDDFRASNPASNEQLLDLLAKDFVDHGYDLKHLIRTILCSHVYQLSSTPNQYNLADTRNFSRSYRRRLPAEVMLDAVSDFTGVPDQFGGLPAGSRAVQTWNNKLDSNFLDAFGRPNSSADCPCERDRGTSIVQALHLMNSSRLQAKLSDASGRTAVLAKSDKSPEAIVRELYLAAYARMPDDKELEIARSAFAAQGATRQSATEDVMWALVNSAEFVFNH